MGRGGGHGEGLGEGAGGMDKHEAAAICGGCGAVCLIVCFCTVGLPALIAGCVLVALFGSSLKTAGIVCIVLSLLMLVGGIVCLALMCAGIIGKKTVQPIHQTTHVAVVSNVHGQPYGQGYGQQNAHGRGPGRGQPRPAFGQTPAQQPGGYGKPPPYGPPPGHHLYQQASQHNPAPAASGGQSAPREQTRDASAPPGSLEEVDLDQGDGR